MLLLSVAYTAIRTHAAGFWYCFCLLEEQVQLARFSVNVFKQEDHDKEKKSRDHNLNRYGTVIVGD